MRIYSYENIDSTSTEAFRLLEEKVPIPFAVSSKEQTVGRGQRSRVWESPKGNFYLSIACAVPSVRVRFLPLRTACILAKWLHSKLRESPTIKWPNDILLNGKKISGILCETFWESDRSFCKAVIGIGINIEYAPLLKNADYASDCLRPYLTTKESTDELVSSFLEFWEIQDLETDGDILREYEAYHLPNGHLWRDREDPSLLWSSEGISPEGHLRVRNQKTGELQELISAQHNLVLLRAQPSHL